MKTYMFELKHDSGKIWLTVRADNLAQAKEMVLSYEKAPARAIRSWHIVPTIRQIQKTKSLLRNI